MFLFEKYTLSLIYLQDIALSFFVESRINFILFSYYLII